MTHQKLYQIELLTYIFSRRRKARLHFTQHIPLRGSVIIQTVRLKFVHTAKLNNPIEVFKVFEGMRVMPGLSRA